MASQTYAYCTFDAIRAALKDPMGRPDPGPDEVARAAGEAYRLAHDAYEKKDPEARALAERLLHWLNLSSHFAAPVQAIPGVIWGVLSRALLADAFRTYGGAPEMTPRQMTERLEAAVKELGCHNHPLNDEMNDEAGNRAVSVWGKNWFGSTIGFSVQLTALSMRCPIKSRRIVLENLADEIKSTPHRDMRAKFLEGLGLRYTHEAQVTDPDRVTESFHLLNFRTAISSIPDPDYALGSFYSIEGNWPPECKVLCAGFRRHGMGEEPIEVFHLHATVDEHHSQEWLEILESSDLTPPQCAKVVDGAVAQLNVRRRMYDSMRKMLYGK